MTGVMLIHMTNTAAMLLLHHHNRPRDLRNQLTNDNNLMIAVMKGGSFRPALVHRPNRNAVTRLSSSRRNMEEVLG